MNVESPSPTVGVKRKLREELLAAEWRSQRKRERGLLYPFVSG